MADVKPTNPAPGTAMPGEVNKPAVAPTVAPASGPGTTPVVTPGSRPAPTTPEHPGSPGAVGPPQPDLKPGVPTKADTQARTPEQEKDKAGPGPTGRVPDPAHDPSGLAPDRDIKNRTMAANEEAHKQKARYEAIKDQCTMLYPMPGQNQKVHNPVTAHGACQITDDEQKDTVIEVRIGGHNKVARAEIAGGKWSAHFDVLPTGVFDFDMYVNGVHHCTAKAEVSM